MKKAQAVNHLAEVEAEIEEIKNERAELEVRLQELGRKLKDLHSVRRYFRGETGQQDPSVDESDAPTRAERGGRLYLVEAAVEAMADGQPVKTTDLVERMHAAGIPLGGPKAKAASYLSTMLPRDSRVEKVGRATWELAKQSEG